MTDKKNSTINVVKDMLVVRKGPTCKFEYAPLCRNDDGRLYVGQVVQFEGLIDKQGIVGFLNGMELAKFDAVHAAIKNQDSFDERSRATGNPVLEEDTSVGEATVKVKVRDKEITHDAKTGHLLGSGQPIPTGEKPAPAPAARRIR